MQGDVRSYGDYTVAMVCAIDFEMSAIRYMLDEEHPTLPTIEGDSNIYVLGKLVGHNVVLACLPGSQGKGSAAVVATNLARTFPSIMWRFVVGIGRGVPSEKHDIRLGDVVVSMPDGQSGGVVQYDLGKATNDGFVLKGFLSPPPSLLRNAAQKMRSDHLVNENKVEDYIAAMVQKGRRLTIFKRPCTSPDVLFKDDYAHDPKNLTCANCDPQYRINRRPREYEGCEIHYGPIASGDSVINSTSRKNDIIRTAGDVLCFEMEAAGLMTEFSCIVVRGVSDYADSHKNDDWHHYAAATAAACAKELLSYITPKTTSILEDATLDRGDGSFVFYGRGVQHSGSGIITVGGDMNICSWLIEAACNKMRPELGCEDSI